MQPTTPPTCQEEFIAATAERMAAVARRLSEWAGAEARTLARAYRD